MNRTVVKELEDRFSDEQQESSDEDMDWSGNNSPFANLSIPQVDGAADESSGELSKYMSNFCSRLTVTAYLQNSSSIKVLLDIMLVKLPLLCYVYRFLFNR